MSLNRALQLKILRLAADAYPAPVKFKDLELGEDEVEIVRNIYYLNAHELLECVFFGAITPIVKLPVTFKATHKGLDFLEDDGGLSAILGVVTIRLHEDTIRELVIQKLESSNLPEEEKRPLLQAVRELPGEAIRHLTTRLLDLGIDNLPGVVSLIQKALQPAGVP